MPFMVYYVKIFSNLVKMHNKQIIFYLCTLKFYIHTKNDTRKLVFNLAL